MRLTLTALIAEHEERYPLREWGITKRGARYRAFSSPEGYVATVGRPNHEIIKAEANKPELALENVLRYLNAKARRAKQEEGDQPQNEPPAS